MLQVFTKEWQIAKTYIYDVTLAEGLINLNWDDFEYFAKNSRPLVAVKNEDDASFKELLEKALVEARMNCSGCFTKIIISISNKEGEGINMDEMSDLIDCMDAFMDRDMEIKWGVNHNDSLMSKHCICVFAFK